MRVILAHKFFYPKGGAEKFFFEVGRVLESHGHEVAYFSTQDPSNIEGDWNGYFPEAPSYNRGGVLSKLSSITKIIYSFEAKGKFQQLVEDFKPDLVHVFSINIHISPSILDVCRKSTIPVVASYNDYKHICPNYKLYHHGRLCEECIGGKYYRAAVNKCCQNSMVFSVASMLEAYAHDWMNVQRKNIHTFLFASEFMAQKTKEFWKGREFRYALLRNPFDATKFKFNEEYGDYLIYFGRLIEEKGVDILIRAMAMAPNAELKIIGDGPQEKELFELTESLGLNNIEFLGPKWGDELDPLLKLTRFVVVPSTWHENFPYVINQAFAFGKAVIGSNLGGIPELVKHGERGVVYEAMKPDVLADCINQLWDDPEKAVSYGRNAKEYVDREFNDEHFYETLMQIYEGVLS